MKNKKKYQIPIMKVFAFKTLSILQASPNETFTMDNVPATEPAF